ncbi:MAG: 2-amino-4-hydroxy-6-hydroxymethyldihydropteridine diphosphokinase [Alphaproteobacteria bacterium]|nr:2-amino-4-hydroxy-6-hydroxymethyldihydropteridine diphosphokinase [Alphaproteobacteria bacterium]
MVQPRVICLIAIGANLPSQAGSVEDTLALAQELLANGDIQIMAHSRIYRTPAFPPGSGPDFVNAALKISTDLAPAKLLARLHEIEATLGRNRVRRWEARMIDLDLLSYGDMVLPNQETFLRWHDMPLSQQQTETPDALILPHPRLHERGFVLVPLLDIAPDWRHPVLGLTVTQMHVALPDGACASIEIVSPARDTRA